MEGKDSKRRRVVRQQVIETDGTKVQTEEYANEEDENVRYVPFRILRENIVRPADECGCCKYDFRAPTVPGKNPDMERLWATYTRLLGTMSLEKLCELLAEQQRVEMYEVHVAEGKECVRWTSDMVFQHLTGLHMVDHRSDLLTRLEDLSVMERKLKNVLFSQKKDDDDGSYKPDLAHIKTVLEIGKAKDQIWAALQKRT